MKTLRKRILLLGVVLFATSAYGVGDHKATKMLGQPNVAMSLEDWNSLDAIKKAKEQLPRSVVLNLFSDLYKKRGEPSIAIFWNRKFDSQLSQWKANDGGGLVENKEAQQPGREKLGEVESFEFSAGYMQPFLETSTKIIDREAIMRLTAHGASNDDNYWYKRYGYRPTLDYQKVETKALVGYAQYFTEIIFASGKNTDVDVSFMVTVKEVSTGRVVAMFKSDGRPPIKKNLPQRWVAKNSGYELGMPSNELVLPKEVGKQLAYETMEALVKVWGKL